jgi:hypothetical protein
MAPYGWLIGVGVLFGFLHVVTGPDHLSVLATLAAGYKRSQAFALGLQWGIGHSSGLLVVAACFLILGQQVDLEKIGQ